MLLDALVVWAEGLGLRGSAAWELASAVRERAGTDASAADAEAIARELHPDLFEERHCVFCRRPSGRARLCEEHRGR